jgi:putative inorganic carbon (hco3(-)) transporter
MLLQTARALFLLLIFSLPLVRPLHFYFFGYVVPLADFIFLATFPVLALAVSLRQTKLKWSGFYLPLGLYLLALFLATIFAENPRASFVKLCAEIYLIALAVIAYMLADSIEFLRRTAYVWLAATTVAIVVSVVSLLLFYFDSNNPLLFYTLSYRGSLPPGNYPRIQSTFLYPNMLCNYLNVSLVFASILFAEKQFPRILWFVWFALFSVAAFFTLSPGIGGILLTLGLWIYFVCREKSNAARLGLALAAISAIVFFLLTLIVLNPEREIEVSQRARLWRDALRTVWQNPLTGRGVGADVASVFFLDASGNLQHLTDAHQIWLNVAGQAGLPGLVAILFVTVYFARKLFPPKISDDVSRWRVGLALGFWGAFVYQGLAGSFEDARHIWVLIGLLAATSDNFVKLSGSDDLNKI